MATLAQHAEILKLARVLRTTFEQLAYLEKLDAASIRQLRERTTASLFDADQHLFHRVAASSRLLPGKITALIAEKALGSLLCARIAGLLPPDRAVDVAKRLHTPFLADVCLEIDPRHIRELIAGMPLDRVVDIARELASRREHIAMARFVDSLPEPAMRAILAALRDDVALLQIGFFVEDPAQLSAVIAMLPDARLRNMIASAIEGDDELWPEAMNLINGIATPQRRHMAALAAGLDDALLTRMLERTHRQSLWPALLPIVAEMEATQHAHLARLVALDDDAILESMIFAAHQASLWPQLLPLVAQMTSPVQSRAAAVAERLGPDVVSNLTQAIREAASPAA